MIGNHLTRNRNIEKQIIIKLTSFVSFRDACEYGHLHVAKWLKETFNITKAKACYNGNEVFRWSCRNGHLYVAKWLHETFEITKKEACCFNNETFIYSCRFGHLHVAKWLSLEMNASHSLST